jgi:hypothetical protein
MNIYICLYCICKKSIVQFSSVPYVAWPSATAGRLPLARMSYQVCRDLALVDRNSMAGGSKAINLNDQIKLFFDGTKLKFLLAQ